MSIDMSQFRQVFFEESFEGLEIMETGLMALTPGESGGETINAIFRAAHSIKGGAGTFGFAEIGEFTHILETLLDETRDGRRVVTAESVDVLLEGVDVLRMMLTAAREDSTADAAAIESVSERLEGLLDTGAAVASRAAAEQPLEHTAPAPTQFRIRFVPEPQLAATGNDPLRLLEELAELGDVEVKTDTSRLPAFSALDPEASLLAYEIELTGATSEAAIREIFEWVEDDAEIEVTPIEGAKPGRASAPDSASATAPDSASAPALTVLETPDDRRSGGDRRQSERRKAQPEASSIRVGTEKIDALINMVGELVITQSMLNEFDGEMGADEIERLRAGLAQLERNTRELQESVMRIRMLPISFAFNRFPRLVRDLSSKLGKKVDLELNGEQTELDKTVMEKIGDPLVHLVRNALDHGIETPEVRRAKGKPETGRLGLNAFHEGGNIVIEIADDGGGLDADRIVAKARERGLVGADETLPEAEIHDLIFHAGFSTAEAISDVSGRGVGMDVVRRNIKDLGGTIEVTSARDVGSTFTIRLPLTLAILDGQLCRVGDQTLIVPLVSIVESLQVQPGQIKRVSARAELYRLRDEYIPIVRPEAVFGFRNDAARLEDGLIVIVESERRKVGLFVDDLLAQQQVVIKSLETNYRRVEGISGATILGSGRVALILDVAGLLTLSRVEVGAAESIDTRVA